MEQNIVLIGLSGCGKTTVGRLLAKELSLPFVDMDEYIEQAENRSVSEIFAQSGENYFRIAETRAAMALSKTTGKVIATGGGAILRKENMLALKETGICIFLDRSVKNILKTADTKSRPLLAEDSFRLYELDRQRRPFYEAYADLTVSENSPEEAVRAILANLDK